MANFNAAGAGKSGIGMSNDRPDDAFIWAGSDTPANAPFRVTMDGELTASSIGGGLVIPVANGGTGYNRQTIHRGPIIHQVGLAKMVICSFSTTDRLILRGAPKR